MKLYGNAASPFARKCRVIAHELGLKLEEIRTLPMQEPEFRRINPLGKIPALVLDDGSVLIDSPVICEYLNHAGGGNFFPGMNIFKQNNGRWKALGLAALGDGIADAAVAYVILGRENPVPEAARKRQMDTVLAALDALERVNFAKDPTIGEISIGCALGYVNFRLPDLDWKSSRPKLSAWYAKFCDYPSMKATVPSAP
ncbi:MAG: glutathione S-transferase N-terminal domain-containing protein [Alphaproteobacteria bacterium]|jgi:glutathione S-transferase